MIPFLRAFAVGLGVFAIFLGVAAKVYGVGGDREIFGSIAIGVVVLVLRFTVLRHRAPERVK